MSENIFESVTIPPKKGIKIRCKCGNIWIYGGKNHKYCSCSKCRTTITINKKKKKRKKFITYRSCVPGSFLHVMRENTPKECKSNLV